MSISHDDYSSLQIVRRIHDNHINVASTSADRFGYLPLELVAKPGVATKPVNTHVTAKMRRERVSCCVTEVEF